MNKEQLALAGLRISLLLLFGVLVLFQVMSLPGQFAYMAQQDPEHAYLRDLVRRAAELAVGPAAAM